jgi:hypothetical protein
MAGIMAQEHRAGLFVFADNLHPRFWQHEANEDRRGCDAKLVRSMSEGVMGMGGEEGELGYGHQPLLRIRREAEMAAFR